MIVHNFYMLRGETTKMPINFKNLIKSITLLPTYKCNARCKGCCFSCSPDEKRIANFELLYKFLDEAHQKLPNYITTIITGGECFTLNEDLFPLINEASKVTKNVRCVSNGFWGKNKEKALKTVVKLKKSGLTELNISSGISHSQWVKEESVINCLTSALEHEIRTILVVEDDNKDILYNFYNKHKIIDKYIKNGTLNIIKTSWADEDRKKDIDTSKYELRMPCENIFSILGMTPYHNLASCCGLSMEHISEFKLKYDESLGIENNIHFLLNDPLKMLLYTDGPYKILEDIVGEQFIHDSKIKHKCELCMMIYRLPEIYAEVIKKVAAYKKDIVQKFILQTHRLQGD